MHVFFAAVPPIAYWVIVLTSTVILITLLGKLRAAPRRNSAVTLLVLVLAIDVFRNLTENVYFGFYWSAIYGIFPESWRTVLENPVFVSIPKLINVATGFLILFLLIRRWFPADEAAREQVQRSMLDSRAQAEKAELRYRRIVDHALDVICTMDRAGRFVDINRRCRDVWGYAPEEMIGRPFLDFVHPDDRPRSAVEAAAILDGRPTECFENRYVRKDGGIVHMMWTSNWSEEDRLFYAVARDVTQRHEMEIKRRELEERLNQSQRLEAVGQLTGGLAHDFNNLLTVIIGNAELMREKLPADSELRGLADITKMAADRGAELSGRLLAFSRRQSLEPRTVDVNHLLDCMGALLRRVLGDDIDIRLRLDEAVGPIYADTLQLESAIINLGVNARDAMPAGGRLSITTQSRRIAEGESGDLAPGDYVEIAVADSGTGMPEEVVAHIFEPFFTTKGQGKGSGLGLSMVYGFVRQSGGTVLVETAPGEGTTIRLLFPRVARDLPEEPAEPAADAAPGGGETILLVEDNNLVRTFAAKLLDTLGYRVLEARSAPEALEALAARRDIDLLFSDVMMPGGMTGHQLALAARESYPGLKILLTSGYAEGGRPADLPNDILVLRKPYHSKELARALRSQLDATRQPSAAGRPG